MKLRTIELVRRKAELYVAQADSGGPPHSRRRNHAIAGDVGGGQGSDNTTEPAGLLKGFPKQGDVLPRGPETGGDLLGSGINDSVNVLLVDQPTEHGLLAILTGENLALPTVQRIHAIQILDGER